MRTLSYTLMSLLFIPAVFAVEVKVGAYIVPPYVTDHGGVTLDTL